MIRLSFEEMEFLNDVWVFALKSHDVEMRRAAGVQQVGCLIIVR